MKRIENFDGYVNEKYFVKDVAKKIGNWISSYADKIKSYGVINDGYKKGKPIVQIYKYAGKGSITNAIKKNYSGVPDVINESAKSDLEDLDKFFKEDPGYVKAAAADPESEIPNLLGDKIVKLLERRYRNLLKGLVRTPVFIYGGPGIGKTMIIGQVAESIGGDVLEIAIDKMSPEDFLGLPSKVDIEEVNIQNYMMGKGVTRYNEPWWLPQDPESKGIIFFDELNRANKITLDAMLIFARERRIGSYNLPEGWMIVAAGNRKKDESNKNLISDLGSAFADRFSIVNYIPTPEALVKYIRSGRGKMLPGANRNEKMEDIIMPELLKFIQFQTRWFYTLDAENDPSLKYASPRGWMDAAQQIYAEIDRRKYEGESDKMSEEELRSLVERHVGFSAATAFIAYYRLSSEMNIEDLSLVFTDPEKAPLPTKDKSGVYIPDVFYAMTTNILSMAEQKGKIEYEEFSNLLLWALRLTRTTSGGIVVPECELIQSITVGIRKIYPSITKDIGFFRTKGMIKVNKACNSAIK